MIVWGYIKVPAHWTSVFAGAGRLVNAPIGATQEFEDQKLLADQSNEFYGIMFDAGSTGSRIHVFKFKKNNQSKDSGYKLLDELFLSTKPGLSSYATNPTQAAESLRGMLDKAKAHIPSSQWSNTALGLKATAGLRLLSNVTAHAILSEVLKLFQSYPFKTSVDGVSILEGAEEGLFCWFTINFLLDFLQKLDNTVGILDLGGGSTQITYLPGTDAQLNWAPAGYLLGVKLLGRRLNIYTHSYLGLGINSVRFQMLGGQESGDASQPRFFQSVCLPNGYSGKWKYAGAEHNISSSSPSNQQVSHFEDCFSVVKSVVAKYNIHRPKDLRKKTFYALSYYYDRAVDVKLIDSENGGQLNVQSFLDAAKKVCGDSSVPNEPFLCLDLCYISSLLVDGFGFEPNSRLLFRKKVDSFEITWALGALFNYYGLFNTHM